MPERCSPSNHLEGILKTTNRRYIPLSNANQINAELVNMFETDFSRI